MDKLKIVTHAGQYHADELMAINLLSIFLGKTPVVMRIKQPNLPQGYLPVDIGGGYLDHHQLDCPTYEDGTRFCAANQVIANYAAEYYQQFGLVNENLKWAVDRLHNDIKPIAQQDNYGPKEFGNTFSFYVSALNDSVDFNTALNIVKPFVVALVNKARKLAELRILNKEIFESPNPIVEIKKPMPLDMYPEPVKYLICRSDRGGFNVTSTDSDNYPVLKIEGCRFLHNTAFLANYDKLENARLCAAASLASALEKLNVRYH